MPDTFTDSARPRHEADVLDHCIESFTTELTRKGYSALVVQQKRATASAFVRWAVHHQLDVATIDEASMDAFLECSGHRPISRSNRPWTLASFLEHLRLMEATIRPDPVRDTSYAALLQEQYETYLSVERGLAEGTIGSYRTYVQEFIRRHFETTAARTSASELDARDVRDFLLARIRTVSPRTAQLVATALRSFLQFLFVQGETSVDLALAVPTVPRWRQTGVHPYLRPKEVERLLAACDRTTANGRRDHAILLLLARLGLRASEVAALELGHLRWRRGEIVVHGKGQVLQYLPLIPDVGAAVALYLRDGRPESQCRSVFLRNIAPRVGLGPDGVGFQTS